MTFISGVSTVLLERILDSHSQWASEFKLKEDRI
jgi:hypothetical protein